MAKQPLHRRIEVGEDFAMLDGKWVSFTRTTVWEVAEAGGSAVAVSDVAANVKLEGVPTEDAKVLERVREWLKTDVPFKPSAFV